MSVIIIGGGDKARAAIAALESASLAWTEERRTAAEALLADFAAQAQEICDGC